MRWGYREIERGRGRENRKRYGEAGVYNNVSTLAVHTVEIIASFNGHRTQLMLTEKSIT